MEKKEYLVKWKNITIWNSRGGEVTENYNTEVVSANSAKEAVRIVFSWYKNLLSMPNRDLEILSVKLIG